MRKLITAAALLGLSVGASAYELNILHINDHHSHLQTNRLDSYAVRKVKHP